MIVVALAASAYAGWEERARLQGWWQAWHAPHSTPAPTRTTVYGWKDKDGVMHYSSTPDPQHKTRAYVIDTGKITPLEPLPGEDALHDAEQTAEKGAQAASNRLHSARKSAEGLAHDGASEMRHLREEMRQKQLQMQDRKMDAAIYNNN